mgnify:CR=1 FL=1
MAEFTFGEPTAQKAVAFKPKPLGIDISSLTEEIRNLSRRLRIIEERYTNLRTKQQVIEQNMLSRHKQVTTEIKTTNSDMHELKTEITEIKDRLLLIIKELKECAKKEEVKVLEKYINLWDPVNFITRNEIEGIVKEIVDKMS